MALTAERFWNKVQRGHPDQCWPWLGSVNRVTGYGQWGYAHGKNAYAHRSAWELEIGPIPDHLQIDHLCRNPICCNPAHMQLLSPGAHGRLSNEQRYGHIGTDEVCRHGHVGERYRKPSTGVIHCHACDRELRRRWYDANLRRPERSGTCVECGVEFTTTQPHRIHCSARCGDRMRKRRRRVTVKEVI